MCVCMYYVLYNCLACIRNVRGEAPAHGDEAPPRPRLRLPAGRLHPLDLRRAHPGGAPAVGRDLSGSRKRR